MTNSNFLKATYALFLSLTMLTLISCNDDDNNQSLDGGSAFPLNIGNYWIYQIYSESETGEVLPTQNFDSVYIAETVVMDGIEYFSLVGWFGTPELIRDSLGYIVNSEGRIHYSPENSDEVFYTDKISLGSEDRFISVNYTMSSAESITISSGVYDTRAAEGEFDYSEAQGISCDKKAKTYYSGDIGRIKEEVFYLSACSYRHRNLVRYHIE